VPPSARRVGAPARVGHQLTRDPSKRWVVMTRNPATVTERIVLNTRTLRIGHQTYQLRNIARVQTVALGRLRKPHLILSTLPWAFGFVLILLVAAASNSPSSDSGPLAITFLAVVGIIIGLIFIYRRARNQDVTLYALLLETTGYPQTVLASPNYPELSRLSDAIVRAIENPPVSEQVYNVQNIQNVHGDQFTVKGHHNTGKKVR